MRTIPIVPVLALAALAAAPLLAQKPGADPEREAYQARGIALCIAELRTAEGATSDNVEAICGCAFDRFMTRWPSGALPPLGPGRFQSLMGMELVSCAAAERPALAGAVARRLAAVPPADAPPVIATAPLAPEEGGKPSDASDAPAPARFNLQAWLDGLSLPRWLTDPGLPLWAWLPLLTFVFLFLRELMRRRDGTRDLVGPPPSLRPGGRPGPPPPR